MFHEERHDLHGITVVVETEGPITYIGRCHDMDSEKVVLMDVDQHDEGRDERSKNEFIAKAAQVGVWPKHKHLALPRDQVTAVTRLSDVSP